MINVNKIMAVKTRLSFQVKSFKSNTYGIRHILTDRETEAPSFSASIYEEHLAHKTESHNSRSAALYIFATLKSWAKQFRVDLEDLLLRGVGLTPAHIRSYTSWLEGPHRLSSGGVPIEKRRSINRNLITCSVICDWFISIYSTPTHTDSDQSLSIQALRAYQKSIWEDAIVKVRVEPSAPDMTEEEIAKVQKFLLPENRAEIVGQQRAVRDYLIWRLAIEFGMRIGEILALRLQDCPTRDAMYFKVVRIEERKGKTGDPRGNPPRPKTLSRDLGILLSNSAFPRLILEYVSTHRYWVTSVKGAKKPIFILPHDLLIIAKSGRPLSIRAADDIASEIKKCTGVDFNWHLARHAFFNRAYDAMASLPNENERNIRKADLLVWGGWQSEQSLDIYTKRARADRSRLALSIWQQGGNSWTALN